MSVTDGFHHPPLEEYLEAIHELDEEGDGPVIQPASPNGSATPPRRCRTWSAGCGPTGTWQPRARPSP